ncbi:phosphorylase family protein, partial [Candidatus Venteria ishoeyi]
MTELAIIGGTGVASLEGMEIERRRAVHTPYGPPSGPVMFGRYAGTSILFLPRHGYGHTIPPHQVNYRANLWSLQYLGVKRVLAFAA